ncbi:hypothetical protein [Sphingomonas sp.]
MVEDRTTTTDGTHTHTVVERRGGGGTLLIGLALLIAVIVGAFFLMNQSRNDAIKTDAITGAAEAVKDGAGAVGDAARRTVD